MRALTAWIPVFAIAAAVCGSPRFASAAPDVPGPLAVTSWDAGLVPLAGTNIHVVVYHPSAATTAYPVVGVVHGASRNGTYQRVLAQTLASYGIVAVVPDMPCQVYACDHNANAMQLLAMLDWAVSRSADAASPIAGQIDGTRRGLIGHSWGALASHLAASRSAGIQSVVLLDPNDDATVGTSAASSVHAPVLQLLAERRGVCNNQWIASNITPVLAGPVLQTTLPRSAHCDPEDPTDSLCPAFCGAGDATTTPFFRRYAVAWTVCNLAADPAMAEWIGGAGLDADVAANHLGGIVSRGIDGLPCRVAAASDAGPAPDATADDGGTDVALLDTGPETVLMVDAARDIVDEYNGPIHDRDASVTIDAHDAGTTASRPGCQCVIRSIAPRPLHGFAKGFAVAISACAGAFASRRRRASAPRA